MINKTINFYSNVIMQVDGKEVVAAVLTATISENQLSHVINANVVNKELILSTESNKLAYQTQYDQFVETVKESLR